MICYDEHPTLVGGVPENYNAGCRKKISGQVVTLSTQTSLGKIPDTKLTVHQTFHHAISMWKP